MWRELLVVGFGELAVQRIENDLNRPLFLLVSQAFPIQTLDLLAKWVFLRIANALDATMHAFNKPISFDLAERVEIQPRPPSANGISQKMRQYMGQPTLIPV